MSSTPNFRASLVSIRFSIVFHKRQWHLIHVCNVFYLVFFTSLSTRQLWMELRDWITQLCGSFCAQWVFLGKWNFETVGKSWKQLIRSFKIFIWIKFFNKLLSSTMKPPTFACFPLILCLFIIIVQCLFHLWKPRSTTSVIWSASTFLIQQTFLLFKPLSNAFSIDIKLSWGWRNIFTTFQSPLFHW